MPSPSPSRLAALALAAAALHGGLDALCSAAALTTPPYLRLGDAPEVFQLVSPLAVSIAASAVSGIIAAIAVSIVGAARARRRALGAALAGFWLFSAVLLRLTWLDTPLLPTIVGLACGIPRGFAVGWALSALSGARVSAATEGAA
ncbi:MAG: hypothetical protein ACJ79R_09140 [Anaeromyxobacteraceae bacterium]